MQQSPFRRAHQMMALIAAAQALAPEFRTNALANIQPYQSRGKGRGNVTYSSSGTNAQAQRAASKARNVQRNRLAHR